MPTGVYPRATVPDRFWSKVDRRKPSDCWPWTAGTNPAGYGRIGIGTTTVVLAHRLAWKLTNGPIPNGLWVLHRCDNPPCCNPAHLFLGTDTDNMRDATRKDRLAFGSRHWRAKLTEQDAAAIRRRRAAGEKGRDLAREFGVSPTTISEIVHHKLWTHV